MQPAWAQVTISGITTVISLVALSLSYRVHRFNVQQAKKREIAEEAESLVIKATSEDVEKYGGSKSSKLAATAGKITLLLIVIGGISFAAAVRNTIVHWKEIKTIFERKSGKVESPQVRAKVTSTFIPDKLLKKQKQPQKQKQLDSPPASTQTPVPTQTPIQISCSEVTIVVRDGHGQPMSGVLVDLDNGRKQISVLKTDESGHAHWRLDQKVLATELGAKAYISGRGSWIASPFNGCSQAINIF